MMVGVDNKWPEEHTKEASRPCDSEALLLEASGQIHQNFSNLTDAET
jgi:hypothetical protein